MATDFDCPIITEDRTDIATELSMALLFEFIELNFTLVDVKKFLSNYLVLYERMLSDLAENKRKAMKVN